MSRTVTIKPQLKRTILINANGRKIEIKQFTRKILLTNKGIKGDSSASLKFTADVSIGGQRAVVSLPNGNITPADSSVLSHANNIIGFTRTSVTAGNTVDVITMSELSDPSFSFIAGLPIFVDANGSGVPTQTPPSSPTQEFSQVLAHAMTTQKIFIRIEKPTLL